MATLALAIAANAQSACYDLFASKNAPLRPGNVATIHYSFANGKPQMLNDASVRAEIISSATNESYRLQIEGGLLRSQYQTLQGKRETKSIIAQKAELHGKIKTNQAQLARIEKIRNLAQKGGRLTPDELAQVGSHMFQQTITLKSRADARLLSQRLTDLADNLATVDQVNLPPSRIKRIFNVMIKHKIVTLILVTAVAGAVTGGYQLYRMNQQADQGVVTQLYDEGTGSAPLATAHDDPRSAIGN